MAIFTAVIKNDEDQSVKYFYIKAHNKKQAITKLQNEHEPFLSNLQSVARAMAVESGFDFKDSMFTKKNVVKWGI